MQQIILIQPDRRQVRTNLGATGMQQTRIGQMARRLSGSHPKMTTHRITSSDLDDRISWLEQEISQGKRDPRIRRIAGEVLAGSGATGGAWNVAERDWRGEVEAFYNYVRENTRYTQDPVNVELFQRPRRTLESRIGDCDDLAILLASLLQAVGYSVRVRVIGMKGSNVFQHIYLLVGLPPTDPKEWMPVDPSMAEGVGWEYPREKVGLIRDYDIEDD